MGGAVAVLYTTCYQCRRVHRNVGAHGLHVKHEGHARGTCTERQFSHTGNASGDCIIATHGEVTDAAAYFCHR